MGDGMLWTDCGVKRKSISAGSAKLKNERGGSFIQPLHSRRRPAKQSRADERFKTIGCLDAMHIIAKHKDLSAKGASYMHMSSDLTAVRFLGCRRYSQMSHRHQLLTETTERSRGLDLGRLSGRKEIRDGVTCILCRFYF